MKLARLFDGMELPKELETEELIECFKRYQSGDQMMRNKIIEHNLNLVLWLIKNKFLYTSFDIEDILENACIGLIKAVDTFKLSTEFTFANYAINCMKNEICRFMRDETYLKKGGNITFISLSTTDSIEKTLEEKLEDEKERIDEAYENKELICIIMQFIEEFPERDREIVKLYFGLGNIIPMNLKKVAEKVGLTHQRVNQILKKRLTQIRYKLQVLGFINDFANETEKNMYNSYVVMKQIIEKSKTVSPIVKQVSILYFGLSDLNPLSAEQISKILLTYPEKINALIKKLEKELMKLGFSQESAKQTMQLAKKYRDAMSPKYVEITNKR